MKKRLLIAPLSAFVALLVTSCGYGLKEVYKGNVYNSPVFEENYYRVWDSKIDPNNKNNLINKEEVIELDTTQDLVFTSYFDEADHTKYNENLLLASSSAVKNYRYSSGEIDNFDNPRPLYGEAHKLSNENDSFKYGVLSKLYDGQMFCEGDYQLSRVQIDESGFGTVFNNQGRDLDYFAVNFKASNDYTNPQNPAYAHRSIINFKVSFYVKNDNKYDKFTYTYTLDNIKTNWPESQFIYTFFGFKINTNKIKNIQGYSIEYDVVYDELVNAGLDHSLMLYEVLFPNSTWH